MSRRAPLPPHLLATAFSVADARRLGITPSRLRAADLLVPTRGVRIPHAALSAERSLAEATPAGRMQELRSILLDDVRGFAPALTEQQFFSHETGLALLGTPVPFTSAPRRAVHVAVRRPHAQPRRRGVIGHRLQQREPARWQARGFPVEHPARMWRQAAALWSVDDLIIAGDFLVSPRNALLTPDDLWAEVEAAGDVRGRLVRALREIRVGSESPEETRLRLLLMRAGLPEPELNIELRDPAGAFVARLDLAYRRYRVAPEYDGRQHASEGQFAKDADRWDAIRRQGWEHVRILSHHVRPDPRVAVDKVARALVSAGWHPGQR